MSHKRSLQFICIFLALLFAVGAPIARPAQAASAAERDLALNAVRRLLDETYTGYIQLPSRMAFSQVLPGDSMYRFTNYVTSNIDHMRVHGLAYSDYRYQLSGTSVTVTGNTARVYTKVNLDYHYAFAPRINSSIYHMNWSLGLTRNAGNWKVSSVDISGLNCFSSFRDKIDKRKVGNYDYKTIVDEVVAVRRAQTRNLFATLQTAGRNRERPSLMAPAGSIPYSGKTASTFAQKYARRAPGSRLFSTIDDGNCTVFASNCVWAGYGGWNPVSGNHALINSRYRMTDDWYGTVSGYPSRSWRSVVDMWNYLVTDPHTVGPKAIGLNNNKTYDKMTTQMEEGDIIQLYKYKLNRYGHSIVVSVPTSDPYIGNAAHVMVCCNTGDTANRPLVDFLFNYDGLNGETPKTRLLIPQSSFFPV